MKQKAKTGVSSFKKRKPVFAKKSFGQNFLVDDDYADLIVEELDLQPDETVFEIGAGRGALTGKLCDTGARVFAIELDPDLIPILQQEFGARANFDLIQADALKFDFREIARDFGQNQTAKLAANLPYYISTAILGKLIEQRECFSEMVLMLQREVVERLVAEPQNSERGFLTVLVEAYARVEKLFDVPPTAFRPIPKVWSSIVRIELKENNLITDSAENEKLLWQIVSQCFLQKRKTILNNLKNVLPNVQALIEQIGTPAQILELARIEPTRRPETLALNEWLELANIILNRRTASL